MPARRAHGRFNQRHRTRRELLSAAARLLKQGATPSIEEVAQAAMVSRATAYRYFPTLDALLVEAPLEGDTPDPEALFARDGTKNPEERIDAAEAALHEMVYRNEAQLRRLLSNSLTRAPGGRHAIPVRQNRRSPLIEAALAPVKRRLTKAAYQRLCAALAVYFGPEAMVVFRDVLQLDETQARKIKSWAVRTLVRAALNESRRT
ncbi:MAG TPA: helix-turn-helix domain-containing protein [Burkholderiales bacterium]|nr:helix-turn-helix domain-containing protein [Burkholderiales bacterium]